jgi:hypothetical protein
VEPAEVPTVRSAVVTSRPASKRPATTPISQALPVDPPPPSTRARSQREDEDEEEEGRCAFMGVAFRDCVDGAPGGDYLSRAIVDGEGAPTADTAYMGLTS